MPKNSIIIPTYTNFDGLRTCVESIRKTTTFEETDVWIVCNGSPREAVEWATALGKPFHVLSCPEPLGYTKALNIGVMASGGDNLILFNDDNAVLDWGGGDHWLRILTGPLEDKSVAVTGSTKDYWSKDQPFLVFFCAATRRDVMHELGYLDEEFNPGSGEDCDYCLKAQHAGYKVIQVPDDMPHWGTRFPIWHVGHVTCGGVPGWREYAARNTTILEKRYPRTGEDKLFQREFSEGRQNIHRWSGGGREKP